MKLGLNIKSHTDSIYKLEKRLDPVNPPYMEYYKSTSNTSPTMGSWSKTIPFWENGYFLWTRWVYTYTNGTLEMSDPVLDKTWSIMTDYEASKSWTKRFDELTNYGKVKGIVCDPISGALYFNADYINSGKIKAQYIDTQGLIIRENSQGYLEPVLVDDGTEGLRLSDVAKSGSYSDLDGKPNLSTVATSGSYKDLDGKPNLSSVATSGQYSDLNGKPALSAVATSGKYSDLDGKPNLSSVATSGNYSDLNDKPNLSAVATSGQYSDLLNSPKLSTVATSGNYSDLNGKPDINGDIKTALKGYIYADGTVGATPKDGATGFLVSSDGTLQASNAVIYGKVVASAGAIGGIYIYKNSIASQNGKFSVDENGYIQAKSGTIGGIDIVDNGLHSWQYLTYNGDYLLDESGNKIIKNLFSLDNEGNLYALNAHIGGSIDIGTSIGNNTTIADLINSKNDFDSRKETIDKNNEIIQQNKSIWDESAKAQIENDRIIANWCKSNDKTLIDGAKIYAGSITAEQITTDNIVGTNGWINIHEGTFNFGDKISWDGKNLSIDATTVTAIIKHDVDWENLTDKVGRSEWRQWSTDNMDTLLRQGRYMIIGGACANSPVTAWFWCEVYNYGADNSNVRVYQRVWKDNDKSLVYERMCYNGKWDSWDKTATSGNIIGVINMSKETTTISNKFIDINGLVTFNGGNNAIANGIKDAKNAGTTAQSNFDNWKSNNEVDKKLNHAYKLVNSWAHDALSDSTTINGGLIETNTITADKIAVNDLYAFGATIGGITINSNSITAPNFSLSSDGVLTASNANITGNGKIASYLIKDGYLMSEDEQVGMSARDTSFWAGYDKTTGSYNFKVTKDGTISAGYDKTTGLHSFKVTNDGNLSVKAGTIGNWSIYKGSLRTNGADTCIQWIEGSSGGGLGTIEARTTTMANKSQVDGQDTRGIIISAYCGATVDIGIRADEDHNSLDPGQWYSALHVDGLSTVIRNPGGSVSSYIQLKEGCITIDPNRFNDYSNSKIIMHGPVYADDPLDGNNNLLLNGNNLSSAYIYEDNVGPYVQLMFGNIESVYGVRAWLSDAKYKNSILDTTVNATSIIRRLAFKQFNWNSTGQHTKIGLVAQELKKIDSDLVTEIRQTDGSLTYQINDVTMAMITAKATQETISRIDKLESSIDSKIFLNKNELEAKLMNENQKLKDKLDYLEAKIKYINGEKSSYSE